MNFPVLKAKGEDYIEKVMKRNEQYKEKIWLKNQLVELDHSIWQQWLKHGVKWDTIRNIKLSGQQELMKLVTSKEFLKLTNYYKIQNAVRAPTGSESGSKRPGETCSGPH